MSTPLIDESPAADDQRPPSRRTPWLVAAAAALVVAGGAIGLSVMQDDPAPAKKTTVALTLPGGGPVMNSCIRFDESILKGMSPAFGGTVSEVGEGQVTIDVDHWYAGGSADQVTLSQPGSNTSASLDGVTFEKGKRYLVTAANGTVNGCGYTGLATPDLEQSFNQAFPSSG